MKHSTTISFIFFSWRTWLHFYFLFLIHMTRLHCLKILNTHGLTLNNYFFFFIFWRTWPQFHFFFIIQDIVCWRSQIVPRDVYMPNFWGFDCFIRMLDSLDAVWFVLTLRTGTTFKIHFGSKTKSIWSFVNMYRTTTQGVRMPQAESAAAISHALLLRFVLFCLAQTQWTDATYCLRDYGNPHCRPSHETVKRRSQEETLSDGCVLPVVLQNLWTLTLSLVAWHSPDNSYTQNSRKRLRAWTRACWVFRSSCNWSWFCCSDRTNAAFNASTSASALVNAPWR